MELPQPRPLGSEGRKATHDFLSLYSSSATQQDPTPPQGGYLKTHDFLQPLERVGKKDKHKMGMSAVEKPPVPLPPPPSVEHILPGGIGTYSISYFNQRVSSSTTRIDENLNSSSSYTGSGFALWDESASAVIKGKTGKENISAEQHVLREAGGNIVGGQLMSVLERPSQSSSNHNQNTATFSSFSSSWPSASNKNQSFMDMITSAKNDQEEEDDDDEEYAIKKEHSFHSKGNLNVKVEAKTIDQKPNTPRSKHSATEQRRRSKINDRFQKLREIIPNSDQKRDKASFLLEVIDYIQFLQEKVNRCESSLYNVWNHEPSKMTQWRNHYRMAEGTNKESVFDENNKGGILINGKNIVESDISTATNLKEKVISKAGGATSVHHPPNIFGFCRTSIAASPVSPPKQSSETWNTMKDQELSIQSGTINISSVYSQGLLNTLTQALQSSGVDLSQASISVQIEIGKRANDIPTSSTSTIKDVDIPAVLPRPRVETTGEAFGQALKRLRNC